MPDISVHAALDVARESAKGAAKIGTTGRGSAGLRGQDRTPRDPPAGSLVPSASPELEPLLIITISC